MPLYVELVAVLTKTCRGEFSTSVCVQHSHLLPAFSLRSRLNALNRLYRLTFRLQQNQPHETTFVIDQQEEEGLTARGRRLDGPVDITVHELQWRTGAVGCLRRKWRAPLFVDEALVAQLVHAFDCRQALHHLLLV